MTTFTIASAVPFEFPAGACSESYWFSVAVVSRLFRVADRGESEGKFAAETGRLCALHQDTSQRDVFDSHSDGFEQRDRVRG